LDLGSREVLYKGDYLHYQQAETNTSIREGWFYRDDTQQKVRNADDVFDIYEGDKVEAGKKSVAIRLWLQDKNATLQENQIHEVTNKVLESLKKNFDLSVR
jgi:hypothetical protein